MRYHFFLAYLFGFLLGLNLKAQSKLSDEAMRQLINSTKSDSTKAYNQLLLAERLKNKQPELAWRLLDSATIIAKNKFVKICCEVTKGILLRTQGQSDSAMKIYQAVLKYEKDTNLWLPTSRAANLLSNEYRRNGDLKKALEYILKVEKIIINVNKTEKLTTVYENLAGIFFDLNDLDKAITYDKKAIALAITYKIDNYLPGMYLNLGSCYGEKKMQDSALFYYRKALATAQSQNAKLDIAYASESLGYEMFAAKQLDSAYKYLMQAKYYFEIESYSDRNYVPLMGYLGMLETKRKNYPLALSYLLKGDVQGAEYGFINDRIEIKKALAEVYAALGNWDKAYTYQESYLLLKDSMQREENIKITRELEGKYNVAKKENENTELKAANDKQEQKLRERNIFLAAAALCLGLLVLLSFFIFKNYKKEKMHVAVLDQLNLQLTEQRNEILNINQLLQLKVLRTQMNPHFIYNCLNAINTLVLKGENDKASSYLLNFAKLLRTILNYSDKGSIDLEEEIAFIKLYLSLEGMRMGNEFSYEVKASQALLEDDIGLPSLLVQPFIENAIWHGLINKEGEKKLSVNFEKSSDTNKLVCIVEDNGIGREKAMEIKQHKHESIHHESKGIKITQERIELLKFQTKDEVSITINDSMSKDNEALGTKVVLILPITV
jgi:tetratricopeptide (TPR) repeat protein